MAENGIEKILREIRDIQERSARDAEEHRKRAEEDRKQAERDRAKWEELWAKSDRQAAEDRRQAAEDRDRWVEKWDRSDQRADRERKEFRRAILGIAKVGKTLGQQLNRIEHRLGDILHYLKLGGNGRHAGNS